MSYLIQANEVIFKNPYQEQNITLRHDNTGYSFIFGNDIEFRGDSTHQAIKFGDFVITREENQLVFKQNGNILMTLKASS